MNLLRTGDGGWIIEVHLAPCPVMMVGVEW